MRRHGGLVAPYKPTPPRVLRLLSRILSGIAGGMHRQPVLYEAGCGLALASRLAARKHGYYSVCVELDEGLVGQARVLVEESGVGHLVDIVEGDVLSFKPRCVTAVYAYLMPEPMERLGELVPCDAVLLSLDYPAPNLPLQAYWELAGGYTLYMHSRLLPASLNASSAQGMHQSSPSRRSVSGVGTPSTAS